MIFEPIIESKEDRPERLELITDQPSKYYLFAPEINTISGLLRALFIASPINPLLIHPSLKKTFGDLEGISLVDYINVNTEGIGLTSPAFIYYTLDGVDYIKIFTGVAGQYGYGLLQAAETDFVFISSSEDEVPINTDTRIYQVFTSTLKQNSPTGNPVPNVLENTLGEITFERVNPGYYKATSAGLFKKGKTVIFCSPIGVASGVTMNSYQESEDVIQFYTYLADGSLSDELLSQDNATASFKIEVYN